MEETPQKSQNTFPKTLEGAIAFQKRAEALNIREGIILSTEAYKELRGFVLKNIEIESSKNPYHNRLHTEEVEERFLRLAQEAGLSETGTQLGAVAALFHDYGHAGRTIRQEAPEAILRKDISNEEFSALAADSILKGKITPAQITAVQVAILGTSFGQTEGVYARPYKPLSNMDKLLAFADIAGFTKGFEKWMEESMNVYREMPLKNLPTDFETIIKGRMGFLGYLESKLTEIEPLIGQEAATKYRNHLAEVRIGLTSDTVTKYKLEFEEIRFEASRKESL